MKSTSPFYNEIFSTNGQIRPHYAKAFHYWETVPSKKRQALYKQSKKFFSGDYAQDPFPRILTQNEFDFISRGVEQRARAILAFLHDYCIGGTRWQRIMPAGTLRSMIERHHVSNTLKKLDPDQLAFPYGPDIIRDHTGRWRVVEDSAGVIGGLGDLLQSHKILYHLVPNFRNILKSSPMNYNDPLNFFTRLAHHFSKKAKQMCGIPLLYLHSYQEEPDQETKRLARIFRHVGIETVTSSSRFKKLQVKTGKNAGIYINRGGKTERVGALILRHRPEGFATAGLRINIKRLNNLNDKRYLKKIVKAIDLSLHGPSVQTALLKKHAWSNFSPGVQFINDKTFGLFVDKMIRSFLKETPLLESIPARPAAIRLRNGTWKLDQRISTALRRSKDRFVVKQVDEDGGSGVWIGQKESKRSLEPLIEKLQYEPEKFIIQNFEHLSVLDNRIVDLRLHAHVDHEKIIVSNTPWGRANWIDGNGKVNIGSNGFTSPIVVLRK